MAGHSNLISRQLVSLALIVLGISCLTQADLVLVSVNHTPRILNTASQWDETFSYTVHTEQLTWDEAKQKCIEDGAHLALIDTYEKALLVGDVEPFDCHVWVGISRSNSSAAWTNVHDSSLVENVPWAPNQPSGSDNCLTIQGCHRGLGDEDCAARKGFVCEKPKEKFSISGSMSLQQVCQLIAPAVSRSEKYYTSAALIANRTYQHNEITTLPEGYAPILNSSVAYKLYKNRAVSWMEAKRLCESEGARLALGDNKEVYKRLIGTNGGVVHVGIHSLFDEWVSLRNGSVLNNLPWEEGQPSGTFDCAGIFSYAGELKNLHCHIPLAHYACELPILHKHDQITNAQLT